MHSHLIKHFFLFVSCFASLSCFIACCFNFLYTWHLFPGRRFVCWILSLCLKQWGLINNLVEHAQPSNRAIRVSDQLTLHVCYKYRFFPNHWFNSTAPLSVWAHTYYTSSRKWARGLVFGMASTEERIHSEYTYNPWQTVVFHTRINVRESIKARTEMFFRESYWKLCWSHADSSHDQPWLSSHF